MRPLLCALGALVTFVALVALLYALLVRWPGLIVAYFAVSTASAVLALVAAVAPLVSRRWRG